MILKNRYDAANQLIPLMEKYRNDSVIVFAIPRGGVPIGYHIAKNFNCPLELLMTKKIGHPYNEEVAVGAVSMEDYITDPRHKLMDSYIESSVKKIRKKMTEQYKLYADQHTPLSPENKTVIIIDDGVATGFTLFAAIKMIRKKNPHKIVVAVPVAPIDTAEKLREIADDFICLNEVHDFHGVGQYYKDFSQVTDEEVIKMMSDIHSVKLS